MKPALTISGAIMTAFARPKFCCSHVMSGSRRKFDSAVSDAASSFCWSVWATAGVAMKPAATATSANLVIERKKFWSMRLSPA